MSDNNLNSGSDSHYVENYLEFLKNTVGFFLPYFYDNIDTISLENSMFSSAVSIWLF